MSTETSKPSNNRIIMEALLVLYDAQNGTPAQVLDACLEAAQKMDTLDPDEPLQPEMQEKFTTCVQVLLYTSWAMAGSLNGGKLLSLTDKFLSLTDVVRGFKDKVSEDGTGQDQK